MSEPLRIVVVEDLQLVETGGTHATPTYVRKVGYCVARGSREISPHLPTKSHAETWLAGASWQRAEDADIFRRAAVLIEPDPPLHPDAGMAIVSQPDHRAVPNGGTSWNDLERVRH